MHGIEVILTIVAVAGGALSVLAVLCLLIDLWLKTREIPNLPFGLRINPINILAHGDLWTPVISSASKRINFAGLCFIAFVLLGLAVGLMSQ